MYCFDTTKKLNAHLIWVRHKASKEVTTLFYQLTDITDTKRCTRKRIWLLPWLSYAKWLPWNKMWGKWNKPFLHNENCPNIIFCVARESHFIKLLYSPTNNKIIKTIYIIKIVVHSNFEQKSRKNIHKIWQPTKVTKVISR